MRIGCKGGLKAAAAAMLMAALLAPVPAPAHEGHAGPEIEFLAAQEALKAMLPEGAKITRRKEKLDADDAAWARDHLGVAVAEGVYTYYLARDPETGAVRGTAMVRELEYEHGDVTLAVGLDADGRVTRAAVLSTNRKYVADFKGDVGAGFLPDLTGLDVAALADAAGRPAADGGAGRFALERLRDMAAVLATFAAAVGR